MSTGRDDENNTAYVSSVSKTSLQAQMLRRFSNQSVSKFERRIIKPPIARGTFDLRDTTGNRGKEHTGNKRRPGTDGLVPRSGMNNIPFELFMKLYA
jgi:hypothetical protein